tara:strand:- start:125993 stop:126865 length:873 start_codon:yes stop_codon:yes gene_type:complete
MKPALARIQVQDTQGLQWALVSAGRFTLLDCAGLDDRSVIAAFVEGGLVARQLSLEMGLDEAVMAVPLPAGAALYGVGLNYADHAKEVGREVPEEPHFFLKAPGSVAASGAPLVRPRFDATLDYEGELAVVIGKTCRYVPESRAEEVIAGYAVCNDVTLRSLARPPTLLLAKSGPSMGVVGPWIQPLPMQHAADLQLQTWVNDELRQDSGSAQMVHKIPRLVARLSRAITLRPGDVIATGAPFGSGVSFDPPRYLRAGDRVRVRLQDVGEVENTVMDEQLPQGIDYGACR